MYRQQQILVAAPGESGKQSGRPARPGSPSPVRVRPASRPGSPSPSPSPAWLAAASGLGLRVRSKTRSVPTSPSPVRVGLGYPPCAWHFTHRWASGPATAIRVRVSCKAKLAVRRAASVIKLAGWPAKAVTGRQHQKQGPRETEELAAYRESMSLLYKPVLIVTCVPHVCLWEVS